MCLPGPLIVKLTSHMGDEGWLGQKAFKKAGVVLPHPPKKRS